MLEGVTRGNSRLIIVIHLHVKRDKRKIDCMGNTKIMGPLIKPSLRNSDVPSKGPCGRRHGIRMDRIPAFVGVSTVMPAKKKKSV